MGRAFLGAAGLLALSASLSACIPGAYPVDFFREMHYQPSQRLLEPERRSPPSDAVPVTGKQAAMSFEQAKALQNPVRRSAEADAAGKRLFAVNCAMCHGADGRGDSEVAKRFVAAKALPPVDLSGARVKGRSDGELYWLLTYGIGNMPPFGDLTTDEQRWGLVQAVRGIQGQ